MEKGHQAKLTGKKRRTLSVLALKDSFSGESSASSAEGVKEEKIIP